MTPFIKKKDIKDWYITDAQDAAVGRLTSYIRILRGKNKPTYNPL